MNIPMTWHQPGAFARHVKENSRPLRKALGLCMLVGTLLWTAPLPFWSASTIFVALTALALGIALIPEDWPRWLVQPIPQADVEDMARAVARDLAFQFLDEHGGRRVPPDAKLFYAIRPNRILVRVLDPTSGLHLKQYEEQAKAPLEARLAAFPRLKRHATAFEMQDQYGDLRVASVPIPQPSNHELLARRAGAPDEKARS